MGRTKRDDRGGNAFAVPVLWIIVLLGAYWLISDWHVLPRLLSSALAAVR
jgi:hypothetical protein